jgi:hypothetical protein
MKKLATVVVLFVLLGASVIAAVQKSTSLDAAQKGIKTTPVTLDSDVKVNAGP